MEMTNMQMSATEAKEYATGAAPVGDAPRYPYGLCICLSTESLAKLGITTLPEVGSELMVMAKVQVTSVGSSQQMDGDKSNNCDLQITDMTLSAPVKEVDSKAFYPNSKMES